MNKRKVSVEMVEFKEFLKELFSGKEFIAERAFSLLAKGEFIGDELEILLACWLKQDLSEAQNLAINYMLDRI